jgi:hypothetical protein
VEGKALVFDDSFDHWAWNDHPTDDRVILHMYVTPTLTITITLTQSTPQVEGTISASTDPSVVLH